MPGIKKDYVGGLGSVVQRRKTKKGLRNKRKAHLAGVRRADMAEKDRMARAKENANQYDFSSNYDNIY